ncbi:MAG: hypothetical protein NVSMB20_05290 [Bradyrhizobium sp.]
MDQLMQVLLTLIQAGVCTMTPSAQAGPVEVQVVVCPIVKVAKPPEPRPTAPSDKQPDREG